jgi:peptidoglycan-N-acetylglucosamine deacetylase
MKGFVMPSSRWLLIVLWGLAVPLVSPAWAGNHWPHGARAAVALTYDDALSSQLENAVPALSATHLRATFFLTGVAQKDVERWRAVARAGHELGNHTIFHACRRADFPAEPRNTSEAYSVQGMLKEISYQNSFLAALDGRSEHGYATPCGESLAGGVDYLEALRASGLVTYARGVVTLDQDLAADVSKVDVMHVPSRGFSEGTTAADLIDWVKRAQSAQGWVVFLFHGVGGDYLQVSDAVHREFLAWLASHGDEIWVAPLGEVLGWAKAHPDEPR